MKSYLTLVFFLFFFANDKIYSQNQNDSIADDNPVFRFIGFIDVFYAYDFNKPVSNFRQSFLYNHNRHNEFAINLGLISLKVEQNKYRANFGLQGGTYTVDNYTGGNSDFRFIHEANVGVLLSNKYPIWLDAGIFSSHIGFESAISMENLTLSRSLVAENSPYFLSGLKVAYQTDPLNLSLILANGWQRIARIEGNSLVSIGTQVTFQTQKNFQFNWSSFLTTEDPDVRRRLMIFNNFYARFDLLEKATIITGFDWGMQQQTKGSSSFDTWMGAVSILQFAFNDSNKAAFRAEYYGDASGVIIDTGTLNGFKTTGVSVNFDRQLFSNIVWRMEGRILKSKDDIFLKEGKLKNNNFTLLSSLAVKFIK